MLELSEKDIKAAIMNKSFNNQLQTINYLEKNLKSRKSQQKCRSYF